MAKLSGLQRDVLALFRSCLRAAGKKPVDTRENFRRFARDEFHKNHGIDRKDFATIEYLIRRGKSQLETYKSDGIRNVIQR